MKRDMRDPTHLGLAIKQLKGDAGLPVTQVADMLNTSSYHIQPYSSNQSCIEKYGRPGDVLVLEPPRGPVLGRRT